MAILLDFSQIVLSACHVFENELSVYNQDKDGAKNILRHVILSQILHWRTKYHDSYGEVIVCCDGKNYWRKNIFPQYKANRKKAKRESIIDWGLVFGMMDTLIEDLRSFFTYKVLKVDGAECDDVISTLIRSARENGSDEPFMIVSADKDFLQLQRFPRVWQVSPMRKTAVVSKNPEADLAEKIIRGDAGDGIPSVLNDDCAYVDETYKSSRMSRKMFERLMSEGYDNCSDRVIKAHWERNRTLIDFRFIPAEITSAILKRFAEPPQGNKVKMFNYLTEKRCYKLLDRIEDF